jgi:hypothetical protein
LKLDTNNVETSSNDFIQLVRKEDEKLLNVEHFIQNPAIKSSKLKKKIKSLRKQN